MPFHPESLPKTLGRKNILKTLTQTFTVLYNFREFIQAKFPCEAQAVGQEEGAVRVTWGHGAPWREEQKRRAVSRKGRPYIRLPRESSED